MLLICLKLFIYLSSEINVLKSYLKLIITAYSAVISKFLHACKHSTSNLRTVPLVPFSSKYSEIMKNYP